MSARPGPTLGPPSCSISAPIPGPPSGAVSAPIPGPPPGAIFLRARWRPLVVAFTIPCLLATSALASGEKGPVIVERASSAAAHAARRALAVGVGRFTDERWPALRFTGRDAEAMATALRSAGFESERLDAAGGTRAAAFLEALESLGRNAREDDVLLLYVSTHGTLARTPEGTLEQVLVFSDTEHDRPLQTGVLLRDLLHRFDELGSQRKVLILATCYSGAGKSSFSESTTRYLGGLKGALIPPLFEVSRATIVLSAASFGETAREDDELGHDIYTHFFLEALEGFDPNGDGLTSVTEAHDYARNRTYEKSGGAQRPTALLRIEGEDPIALRGRKTGDGHPMLTSYEPGFDGYRVFVDGREKGQLPGGIVLEPGWHDVSVMKPKATDSSSDELLFERSVHAGQGDWIDLGHLYALEPSMQVELQLGAWMRPGSTSGSSQVFLGFAGASFRWQALLLGLDLGARIQSGLGRDTLTINRERIRADLWESRGALGLGTHFDLGGPILHLDIWGGGAFLRRAIQSPYFQAPQQEILGSASLAASLRWRVGESLALGGGLEGAGLFGKNTGLGVTAWIQGGLSF